MRQNLRRGAVAAAVAGYSDCKCGIEVKRRVLLLASLGQVWPRYVLEKEGGFREGDQRSVDFATGGLALGGQFARDMIYDACIASADTPVGHPTVIVGDIESGRVRATRAPMGAD